MLIEELIKLQYPIGKFQKPDQILPEHIEQWIESISELPVKLEQAVAGLQDEQLDVPYRDGGWTIRQVVHHLADSHINSYCRFRLALTEDNPVIRPYYEECWAELSDAKHAPIDSSIRLLIALHQRWVLLLKSLKSDDFQKTFYHPESKKTYVLDVNLGIYAWHGEHHVAHIVSLRNRMKW